VPCSFEDSNRDDNCFKNWYYDQQDILIREMITHGVVVDELHEDANETLLATREAREQPGRLT